MKPITNIYDIYNFEVTDIIQLRSKLFKDTDAKEQLLNMLKFHANNTNGESLATNIDVKELEKKIINYKNNITDSKVLDAFNDMIQFKVSKRIKKSKSKKSKSKNNTKK